MSTGKAKKFQKVFGRAKGRLRDRRGSTNGRIFTNPLRDTQRQPAAAWCRRCRNEIYAWELGDGEALCPQCRAEKNQEEMEQSGEIDDFTGDVSGIPDSG